MEGWDCMFLHTNQKDFRKRFSKKTDSIKMASLCLHFVARRAPTLAAAMPRTVAAVFSRAPLSTQTVVEGMPTTTSQRLQTKMAEINQPLEAMKTNYAVDAPDGESDGHIEEELEEVKHIMDDTGKPRKPPKKDDKDPDPFGIHIH